MFGLPTCNLKMSVVVWTGGGALVLSAAAGLLFLLPFRGPAVETARDYEECVAAIAAGTSWRELHLRPDNAHSGSLSDCSARFAGRRKPGGGYTYFDFMQDRSFDIAGPNPTAAERSRIDRDYLNFLDMQRRERISAELAKKHDEEQRLDSERASQSIGRPLILTPKNPPTQALKRLPDRTKPPRCADNSLACGWSKLSAAVRDTFASSSRSKP